MGFEGGEPARLSGKKRKQNKGKSCSMCLCVSLEQFSKRRKERATLEKCCEWEARAWKVEASEEAIGKVHARIGI